MFAVLRPDQSVQPVEVTPTLYPDLLSNFDQFKGHTLVSVHSFSKDWATWERHPAGDEIVMLLAGPVTLHLQTDDGETAVTLTTMGQYIVIPQGLWHTAKVSEPTTLLFITPGEGTENVRVE
ncbi:MAG: cupin [Cyanobacteria bacterium P01_A01_bin.105]